MPKIHVLPENLANQVAAGEVVERPASVVKELLENSVDAGAGKVEVLVQRGGIALMRVVDDGEGMSREDAELAVRRHATSKLRTGEDLGKIATLGFRGEALPSIASVSRFCLTTRERGAEVGTSVRVDGGDAVVVGDAGEAPGTQVEVRNLFFNVPARRKFLRTEATEFGHVEHQVRLQAAAHPEVGFSMLHNGRLCFQLPPTRDVLERVRGLAGGGLAERLIEVSAEGRGGLVVRGYVGEPGLVRSSRSGQQFFLNRRPVENAALANGLREGFRGALARGSHPVAFLYLEMPFGDVDVNVHPAKREVRFRDGIGVRDLVAGAVAEALERRRGGGGSGQRTAVAGGAAADRGAAGLGERVGAGAATAPAVRPVFDRGGGQVELAPASPREDAGQRDARAEADAGAGQEGPGAGGGEDRRPRWASAVGGPEGAAAVGGESAPGGGAGMAAETGFEFLGELEGGYVLLRSDEGLVLMDRRAAHERVLFERYRTQLDAEGLPSQTLLVPVALELPPKDFAFASENLDALADAGLVMGEFGANTFKVDAVPAALDGRETAGVVAEMVEELRSGGAGAAARVSHDRVAAAVSRIAVRSGDRLSRGEIDHLIGSLLACEMPYCSPSGRPTLVQISYREIDRKFGKSR